MVEENTYFHTISSSPSASILINTHHLLINRPRMNGHHMGRGVMYGQVLKRERRNLASHQCTQGRCCFGEGFWIFNVLFVAWWEGDGVEVGCYLGFCVAGWCWGVFECFHCGGVGVDVCMIQMGRKKDVFILNGAVSNSDLLTDMHAFSRMQCTPLFNKISPDIYPCIQIES